MANLLVIVRHGQSEWNKKNLFTGWKDPDLTDQGRAEAVESGQALKAGGYEFDVSFTSELSRAQKTNTSILNELGQQDIEIVQNVALNERDYGDLAGLNKDDAREKWGEEQVHIWRRSYDTPPPGGESLKDTADRVLPYYNAVIKPRLLAGERIIIAAHGNSLRALTMELEGLSREEVLALNIATGAPIAYELDDAGKVLSKKVLIEREAH